MVQFNKGMESITQAEHISPDKTGDNIDAKRVASYGWDGSNWQRIAAPNVGGVSYDYLDVQQTSATVETYVFKSGGSGGTTVQTITITYTDSSKANLDTVVWS